MADDEVMFRFSNNMAQNADEIVEHVHRSVRAIEEAARAAGGTQVPMTFGDDIIREANRAVQESHQAFAKLLDPRTIGDTKRTSKDINAVLSQSAVGAFQQTQAQIDTLLDRLGPAARSQIEANGKLNKLMNNVANAIAADVNGAYQQLYNSLDAQTKKLMPAPRYVLKPDKQGDTFVERQLRKQDYVLGPAETRRVERMYGEDKNPEAILATERRAAQLRERDRANTEARRKKAEDDAQRAGTTQVRAQAEDERRTNRREEAIRRLARMQIAAEREDKLRKKRRDDAVQAEGRMQDAAISEDDKRTRRKAEALQRYGRMQEAASAEDTARAERTQTRLQQRARQQIAAQKEEDSRQAELGRLRVSGALARTVGNRDPYAEGLGYRMNPATGLPTRRRGGGYEDITNLNDIEEAMRNIDNLRNAHSRSLSLENDPDFKRIGNTKFARLGDDPATATYFERATRGAHQLWVEVSGVDAKIHSATDAQNAFNKELQQGVAAAARQNAKPRNFVQGVAQGAFGSGFNGGGPLDRGAVMGNLGRTVGSAARYSVAYGGFYGMMNGAQEGLAIFQDYQDSFTDYQVALGEGANVTQSMTNDLMELSRVLGENVGAAYDAAARGVRAFASGQSEAQKEIAGFATASAAQKVSVIANKSLTDATGDVIAIGGAYGMSATQSELLIPDWLANAKREVGGDPTQIAQGLSNFAVTATESGFSGQEAANLIALVQSRTDQSGQAVSTRLSRIMQIVSGSTGRSLAMDVNRTLGPNTIDVSATAKEQLMQYGDAYVQAGKDGLEGLQAKIRSQLGGTSNLKELLPILEEAGQEQLARALKNSLPGAGTDEYERKVQNLIGTLNKLRGSIQNIVVLAANADLFAPFAIAVRTAEPLLHLLENILKIYEKIEGIPGGLLKDVPVLSNFGAFATTGVEAGLGMLAYRKVKKSTFATEIAGTDTVAGAAARAMGVAGDAADVAATARDTAAKNADAAATTRDAEAKNIDAAATGRLAAAANAASAALSRLGITGAVNQHSEDVIAGTSSKGGNLRAGIALLLGALAVQEVATKGNEMDQFAVSRADLMRTVGGGDVTKLNTTKDSLDTLSANQKQQLGWLDKAQGLFGKSSSERTAADAKVVQGIAKQIAAENKLAASHERLSVFGDAASRTADSIAESFAALNESGDGARTRLDKFFRALMTPPADALGSWEQPKKFAGELLTNTNQALADVKLSKNYGSDPTMPDFLEGVMGTRRSGKDVRADLQNDFDEKSAYKVFADRVKAAGKGLNRDDVMSAYGEAFDVGFEGADVFKMTGTLHGKEDEIRQQFLDLAGKNIKILQHQVNNLRAMSPAELQAFMTGANEALEEANPADPEARAEQARRSYVQLLARRNATGTRAEVREKAMAAVRKRLGVNFLTDTWQEGSFGGRMEQLAGRKAGNAFDQQGIALRDLRNTMRTENVALAEDARAAAEARASKQPLRLQRALRVDKARDSFRAADQNVALLEGIMESLDRQTVRTLLEYRKTAVETARIAYKKMLGLVNEAQTLLNEGLDGAPALSGHPGAGAGGQDHSAGEIDPKLKRRADEAKEEWQRRKRRYKAGLKAYERAAIGEDTYEGADTDTGKEHLTAWQKRALRAQALRNPDDAVGAARDNLDVARANLDAAEKGTSEYFSALQAVTQSESALADTLAARSTAFVNLAVAQAGGGQLATAKGALDAARIQLSTQTPGTAGYAQAMAEVINGEKGMREAHAQDIASSANLGAARGGGGQMAQARAALTSAGAKLNAQTKGTSEYNDALAEYIQAQQGMRDAAASTTSAIAEASAAKSNSPIANARAQIAGAQAQMRTAAKNTAEWFQALAGFYQGQWALRDAVAQYKNNIDLLNGDSTDPVEQARDALRAARRKLRMDRRAGAGADVQAEDQVARQEARNALRGAKFDQRFSDMQTAEDLGRISFAKYMSYLDHEHDRLSRIKHRTRQQQDQLDQVDKAMKDALSSMDSQFNLGDINTNGLVYQVRRFQAEARNAAASAQLSNNTQVTQTVTIAVDGADTAKVKSIINDYLGVGHGQTRTLTRRKV